MPFLAKFADIDIQNEYPISTLAPGADYGFDIKWSAMGITQNNSAEGVGLPQEYQAVQEFGDHYTSIGDYAQAQRCYEKAASLAPDEPAPYVGLGTIALAEKWPEEAETAFKVAIRLDRKCSRAYCGLAIIHQRKGDFDKAFDMYLKCLELDTDNLAALLGLFQTSCQTGSFSKIRGYLEVYLKAHPADTKVMFCLAALYDKDEQLDKAKETLSEILTLEPLYTEAANLIEEVEHQLVQRNVKNSK